MRQSIRQTMLMFGVSLQHEHSSIDQRPLGFSSMELVHVFSIQVVGAHPDAVMTDRYEATAGEYSAIQALETSVVDQYLIDFVNRMETFEKASSDYEEWLDLMGVCFGVTVEDNSQVQAFWRRRFDRDSRVYGEFVQVMTSPERAREFFSLIESR